MTTTNNDKCPYCELHCSLTEDWSGICGMYKIERINNHPEIINRLYADHQITEFYRSWIESVPMFHYKPGSMVANIGTISCNYDCKYCLNERLARVSPDDMTKTNIYSEPPEILIKRAKLSGISSIVFGENEPVVSMDYVKEMARLSRKKEMDFGISTNGFMTKSTITSLLDIGIDYVNFDIKSFNPKYLREIIGLRGTFAERARDIFLRNLKLFYSADCVKMIEVSTPVIHKLNDYEVIEIAKEIGKINPQIPYHIQRIVPEYQFKEKKIAIGNIENTREYFLKAKEILDHVYFGAYPNSPYVHTECRNCGEILIKRADHGGCYAEMTKYNLENNRCPNCKNKINIVL